MDRDRVQLLRQTESPTELTACPLCLRVLRGSEWMEAERVVREIRSYAGERYADMSSVGL